MPSPKIEIRVESELLSEMETFLKNSRMNRSEWIKSLIRESLGLQNPDKPVRTAKKETLDTVRTIRSPVLTNNEIAVRTDAEGVLTAPEDRDCPKCGELRSMRFGKWMCSRHG